MFLCYARQHKIDQVCDMTIFIEISQHMFSQQKLTLLPSNKIAYFSSNEE